MANLGKQFEEKFSSQFRKQFPKAFCYRLPDQMSGYSNSVNPCDFFCFVNGRFLMVETKVHLGNTINIRSDIPQFEYMKQYVGRPGIYPIIVIWFIDHDKIVYVKEEDMIDMVADGLKSVNISREAELEKYHIVEIPSEKAIKFMKSDFSILSEIK